MAYVAYYDCDICDKVGYGKVDQTMNITTAKRHARKQGWQIGKRGWVCPNCQKKQGRKTNENDHSDN